MYVAILEPKGYIDWHVDQKHATMSKAINLYIKTFNIKNNYIINDKHNLNMNDLNIFVYNNYLSKYYTIINLMDTIINNTNNTFMNDIEFVKKLLKTDGLIISHNELFKYRNNIEIAYIAINQNCNAIKYFSDEIKSNKNIMDFAISKGYYYPVKRKINYL